MEAFVVLMLIGLAFIMLIAIVVFIGLIIYLVRRLWNFIYGIRNGKKERKVVRRKTGRFVSYGKNWKISYPLLDAEQQHARPVLKNHKNKMSNLEQKVSPI